MNKQPEYMTYDTFKLLSDHIDKLLVEAHAEYCRNIYALEKYKYNRTQVLSIKRIPDREISPEDMGVMKDRVWETYCMWRDIYSSMKRQLKYAFEQGAHKSLREAGFFDE